MIYSLLTPSKNVTKPVTKLVTKSPISEEFTPLLYKVAILLQSL